LKQDKNQRTRPGRTQGHDCQRQMPGKRSAGHLRKHGQHHTPMGLGSWKDPDRADAPQEERPLPSYTPYGVHICVLIDILDQAVDVSSRRLYVELSTSQQYREHTLHQ
jgi:hypothetical protein